LEGDAILSVQIGEREVAELRWDGAIELIVREVPERRTMTSMRTIEDASYHYNNNVKSDITKNVTSEIIHSVNRGRCDSVRTAVAAS